MISNLTSLGNVMKKAEKWASDNKVEQSKLLEGKLAPDMFDFPKHFYVSTNAAKHMLARVAGIEVPTWEDTETTFEQLHARVDKTIALLKSVDEKAFQGKEQTSIKFSPGGHEMTLTGLTYIQYWALPNFFFHVVTAYDILRNAGVDIGKLDFLSGGLSAVS